MGAKKVAQKIVFIQLLVTSLIAVFAFIVSDGRAFYSALIGGSISVLATVYFAGKIFSVRIGAPAAKIAQAFYIAEVVKLLLNLVLLSAALLWLDIAPLPLLLAYMATLTAYWLALPFTFDASVRTP